MFDALTTERPWQQARTSFDALSLMKEHVDVEVDRQLFRIFVNMMGQLEA
jgi:HD-GYP domain-containing protein (c-di-GMP phosphodiesterase class II)